MNSERVSSDVNVVKNRMNKIIEKTIRLNDVGVSNGSFSGENELFAKLNEVVNLYITSQKKLMEKLNNKSKSIVAIAENYEQMDKNLAKKAEELK